ncbi:YwqG family protein [Streptomyces sp. NPDC004539]|uniref:YwqG family protein n=1 Tax=Streptomyces sp. NPDC004539 TaxID=3154280 RepID=UPI0033A4CBBF
MTDAHHSRPAAAHLPPALADAWTALLRPCARLRHAADGEPVAAVLGGTPHLPAATPWPEWPGHGPLSFVASVDCAALPRESLSEEFPPDGTLLFFFWDGRLGDDVFVSAHDPETWIGAQVLYVPRDTPTAAADTPAPLTPYPRVDLTAGTEESAPDLLLPQSRRALLGDTRPWPHPRETPPELRPFVRAFSRLRTSAGHQIGGHAIPLQGPVEHEISGGSDEEAERWVPLAQFDSDLGMSWGGDEGTLYWLIRPEDLAARRFDLARFTGQS